MRSLLALMLLIPLSGQTHETEIYRAGFPQGYCPPPQQAVIYESMRYGDDWGRGFSVSPRQVYEIRMAPYASVAPSEPVQPPKSYGHRTNRLEGTGVRRDLRAH